MKNRRICLESLEDRCLLAIVAGGIEMAAELAAPTETAAWVVNSLDDPTSWDMADDVLSLREAIDRAQAGDTITFDAGLTGGTITLSGSQLEVDEGITIDASLIGGITIDADGQSRVFYISGGNETNPVELIGLTVTGGRAYDGGGIYNCSTVALTDSTISGNTAESGGGIFNALDCTVALTDSTISGNTASYWGGGIYNYYYSTLALTNSTVSRNTASYSGGGIYNHNYSTVTLMNSTVSVNTAGGGGGICNDNNGTVTLTNSTVSGNTANNSGGGIYNYNGTVTFTNSTVSGNTADDGGGIFNYDTLKLTNTIVSANYADHGSNISHTKPYSGSNNIIGLDPGFVVAPIFEDGVLVNADELDLSLTAESIAIDAGTNAAVDTETDLAGNPRIVAAWREIATVDIGAFEYQGIVPHGPIETPSTVVTTTLDIVNEIDGLISLREAISYAAAGDIVTFDPVLDSRTIVLAGGELTIDRSLTIDASAVGGITINADGKSRAFYVSGGDEMNPVELIGLTITGGFAYYGGGICNSDGMLVLTNSVVSGNTAEYGGGGIGNGGTTILTNSTVSGNTTIWNGGGIDDEGVLTLTNTIVSNNYADYDSDISHTSPYSGSNNIIGLDPGFVVAPIFEDGVLVNADELDLSLTAESIAIDAGTNAAVNTETDLAGNPRIVAAWRGIATVDIGAFEYQGTVTRGAVEMSSTTVTTPLDIVDETDGLISLREAISYAVAGDTVTFDPVLSSRAIILAGAELTIDKALTIDASAVGGITIDADGKSRVFYVSGGDEVNPVELIGLTITGGFAFYGGGICNSDGVLVLTNSTVSGNTAYDGGGIDNDGTLSLTRSTVSLNTTYDEGGGIYNAFGTLTLTDSTVSGNTAHSAGGIYNDYNGTVTLTNSIVSENTAYDGGGGIGNLDGTVTLTDSTVSGNTADYYGGGIYNYGYDSSTILTLTNCTMAGNSAERGGGIYNGRNGTATVTNCTIADNTAKTSGGGIYQTDSSAVLTLRNSIIVNNTIEKDRSEINGYNVLSLFTDWDTHSFCIQYDPSLPLFNDAANGDYTLAVSSQAIDEGNNEYIAGYDADLAGNPRIVSGIVDLGAYEYQFKQVAAPTILTGNRGVYVSYGANRHQIVWDTVENASGYELEYSSDGSAWTTLSAAETSAVATGLTYGTDMQYRVRALGSGSYADSKWSTVKTFKVCPMDIDGDGDITGGDYALMVGAWLSNEGEEEFVHCADIDGDGDVTGADRAFLVNNWLLNVEDDADDLFYPLAKCADAVFDGFASADLDADWDVF